MTDVPSPSFSSSARTTVKRGAKRAIYDRALMFEILRSGTVAHVGVMTDEGPLVLPMVYGVSEDTMYLHAAQANSLLGASVDAEICATVTIVDGLVFAKTPFNHSMNYRSVVVRGRARLVVDDDETLRALRLITDHIVPTWDTTREPSPSEVRATKVVSLPLAEMSGKARTGGPVDDEVDSSAPYWSGHVPIVSTCGSPVAGVGAAGGVPEAIKKLAGSDLHGRIRLDK